MALAGRCCHHGHVDEPWRIAPAGLCGWPFLLSDERCQQMDRRAFLLSAGAGLGLLRLARLADAAEPKKKKGKQEPPMGSVSDVSTTTLGPRPCSAP